MAQNDTVTEALPEITKIETTARVGENGDPAVVIWFANDSALRYRWGGDQIREETYLDGVIHDSFAIGGEREDLAEYALESVSEYVGTYREDPEACELDWSHVYEMLVATADPRYN